ncbi:MAG: HAMP domain-containing histidine kinase [Oscillospiraceae bacterium]|nr:HAMP domain-containing histidine kinase [Oscillospiraceae bacterium]
MVNDYRREVDILDAPAVVCLDGLVTHLNPLAQQLFPNAAPGQPLAKIGFPLPAPGHETTFLHGENTYFIRWMMAERILYFQDVTAVFKNAGVINTAMREALAGLFAVGGSLFHALEEMPNPVFHEKASLMNRSMCKLLRLVNNVRDFTSLTDGDFTLHTQTFHLGQWLGEFFTKAEPMIAAAQVCVDFRGADIDAEFLADRWRVETALYNLLANAVVSAGKNGHIAMTASLSGENAVFTVSDSGAAAARPDFLSYTLQFPHKAPELDLNATGLSLGLCRKIAELHGGRLWAAASETGTRVTLTIPLHNTALEVNCSEHLYHDGYPPELVYFSTLLPAESYRFM